MEALRAVMAAQAVVFAIYGLPYLFVPANTQVITGQPPVPETYVLRVIGIAFVMLAWLEFQIAADLPRYRGLTLTYVAISAFYFVTIALQLATTGFNGAVWYWRLNLVISAAFAIAVLPPARVSAVELGVPNRGIEPTR
jgi:hypothetical protein